jgi:hypothetical protein
MVGFVAVEDMIDRDEKLPCNADYGSLTPAHRGDALVEALKLTIET